MNRGWIFRTPSKRICPRCGQEKYYFLVEGNLSTDNKVVCCSDCYWQECQDALEQTWKQEGFRP